MSGSTIDALVKEVQDLWEDASFSTSGAEGFSAMCAVRKSQAKLAEAYVAAADGASDHAERRSHLEQARAAMLDVLTSAHGPEHEELVATLRRVLEGLGVDGRAHHRAIATGWLAEAERTMITGQAKEARQLARQVGQLLRGAPGADDLVARARALESA